MNKPFVRGKDSTLKLFITGNPVQVDVKSWTIKREVTKVSDPVCGEDRDRLDTVTNFYSINLQVYYGTAKLLKALLEDQENDDAGALPLERDVAGVLREKGGAKGAMRLTGVTLDDWDIGAGSRADSVMVNLPLRSQYVDEVKVP